MELRNGVVVAMETSSRGSRVFARGNDGRELRMPWMRNAYKVHVVDGRLANPAVAIIGMDGTNCRGSERGAMAVVAFYNATAAAEILGGCGAQLRFGRVDRDLLVVDDTTRAVWRVNGTEFNVVRGPAPMAGARPTAAAAPVAPTTPVAPTAPLAPAAPATAPAAILNAPVPPIRAGSEVTPAPRTPPIPNRSGPQPASNVAPTRAVPSR